MSPKSLFGEVLEKTGELITDTVKEGGEQVKEGAKDFAASISGKSRTGQEAGMSNKSEQPVAQSSGNKPLEAGIKRQSELDKAFYAQEEQKRQQQIAETLRNLEIEKQNALIRQSYGQDPLAQTGSTDRTPGKGLVPTRKKGSTSHTPQPNTSSIEKGKDRKAA